VITSRTLKKSRISTVVRPLVILNYSTFLQKMSKNLNKMKPSREMINSFFESKKVAVAGVSRNPKKFSTVVFNEMKERGFDVYPVNPNVETLYGVTCYPTVSALPADVTRLVLVTSKKHTMGLLKDAVDRGMQHIWIQQMSETPEAIDYVKTQNLKIILKQCILMNLEPVKGFHKFHRTIYKIFGVLPK
jgi:uncharacterized protein